MPAKELTPEQLEDAKRLRCAFDAWQAKEKADKRPSSQAWAASQLNLSQGGLNQYMGGNIPLNAKMVAKCAHFFGIQPAAISPSITAAQLELLKLWMKWADPMDLPQVPFGYLKASETLLFQAVRRGHLDDNEIENLTDTVSSAALAKSNRETPGSLLGAPRIYFSLQGVNQGEDQCDTNESANFTLSTPMPRTEPEHAPHTPHQSSKGKEGVGK